MSLETWVSIGSLLVVALTLAAFTRSTVAGAEGRLGKRIDSVEASLAKRIDSVDGNLTKRIDSVEANLTKRIDSVEANLTKRIDDVEKGLTARIDKLDDRVYALAVGMKPLLAEAEEKAARAATRRPA